MLEIRDQAILADQLGFHSAWIGEHHFDRLGVNSRPDLLLASIIPETQHIRLAPAVTVLPLHHPLHVAESWATLDLLSGGRVDFATGRGYDRLEYEPFGVSFMESQERFAESIDVVLKAWTEPGVWSHKGTYYDIQAMEITPKPIQQPIPCYIACFSGTSMAMGAARGLHIIFAPFAAASAPPEDQPGRSLLAFLEDRPCQQGIIAVAGLTPVGRKRPRFAEQSPLDTPTVAAIQALRVQVTIQSSRANPVV